MRGRDHILLSGPLAVVLTIVGIAVQSNEPGTRASGAEIASYFTAHKTQVAVGTILLAIAASLLIVFGARLRERWREQAPDHGTLSLVVFGGGIATAAGIGFGCAITYTLTELARHAPPQTLQALNALITGSPLYFTLGLATMIAGMSTLAVVGHILPAWLGWIGGLLAIGLLVPGGSPAGPLGALWLIVSGLLLHHRSGAVDDRLTASVADRSRSRQAA